MRRKIVVPLVVLLLMACTVKYYAEFDYAFYVQLEDLRVVTLAFFDRLAYDQEYLNTDYTDWEDFYVGWYEDIDGLRAWAERIPHNDDTIKMLGLLEESMHFFEQLHIIGFEKTQEILLAKSGIMAHFDALKALEEAKKREDE